MPDLLPPEVARRPLTNGFAYDLPRRPLGRLRWLSVFLIVLGVAFAGGPLFGVLWFGSGGPSNDVFDLIGILFAAIFMVPGGAVVLLGLAMLEPGGCSHGDSAARGGDRPPPRRGAAGPSDADARRNLARAEALLESAPTG